MAKSAKDAEDEPEEQPAKIQLPREIAKLLRWQEEGKRREHERQRVLRRLWDDYSDLQKSKIEDREAEWERNRQKWREQEKIQHGKEQIQKTSRLAHKLARAAAWANHERDREKYLPEKFSQSRMAELEEGLKKAQAAWDEHVATLHGKEYEDAKETLPHWHTAMFLSSKSRFLLLPDDATRWDKFKVWLELNWQGVAFMTVVLIASMFAAGVWTI